ncbi:hypothetical protein GCM10028822_30300 [Hymenobacter terrigena]
MAQSILQDFLTEHLITIDQNEEFDLLSKAAQELEKRLRTKKMRLPTAVQVAFDPSISATDPLVAEVQEVITSKWKAFPSKCRDRPIPYVRAVLLTALQALTKDGDSTYAGIVWLTASNYFPYTTPVEREAELLSRLLGEVGNQFEQASWRIWGITPTKQVTLPVPKIAAADRPTVVSINPEYAVNKLAAAMGKGIEGGNKTTFFQRNFSYDGTVNINPDEEWVTSFSTIAGGAVKVIADTLVESTNKALAQTAGSKQLEEFSNQVTNYLREISAAMSQQAASNNLRGQLLWLKETLYSTSQDTSYRQLPAGVVELALASDTQALLPPIYPISVEYFLRETLGAATSGTEEPRHFEEWLLSQEAASATLQPLLPLASLPEAGRLTLLAFVRGVVNGKLAVADFESTTGLRLTDTISRQELTVWLFRELQALKLAAAK